MNKITLFLLLLSVSFIAKAQSSWKKLNSKNLAIKSNRLISRKNTPEKFILYSLALKDLESSLKTQSKNLNKTIDLPDYNGTISSYYFKESSNFTGPLNPMYGFIKTYNIQNVLDNNLTGKLSIGSDGVHITLHTKNKPTLYIDPYTKDLKTYVSYNRNDIKNKDAGFGCQIKDDISKDVSQNKKAFKNANDGKLRTYRLALSCTGEYARFHINNQGVGSGTEAQQRAAVLSAMNTTMARVNGLFERDVSVRMNIVLQGGNNPLIFLNPGDGGLSNSDGFALLDENQELCDNVIGTANYDIGHIFSTGGGGVAVVPSVCSSDSKAKGVTGSSSPNGDPFDVDFVAHEIGHQFGAPHTFNSNSGSCSGNRTNRTAVEPGSGSTIMAYAGICSPHNVQRNSDDYFHAISIQDMWNHIQSTSCGSETDTGNNAPTADAGSNYSVPKLTPIKLKGTGNDVDGNGSLTYCWEQMDNEIATLPPREDNSGGAMFRSFPPTSSGERYLPKLSTVIAGSTSSTWEVIPEKARDLNFSLTVRDNNSGGGSSARSDMTVTVTDADPFIITSPNRAVTWDAGTNKTITWDKSTTDVAPINCSNVSIKLSTDGGLTFPIILVNSTPNDGSHTIVVPNNITNTAKIMIEAVDHIFYNVNNENITIIDSGPTFVMSNTSLDKNICKTTTSSVSYVLDVDYTVGFSETVNFSVLNLPPNSIASFDTNNISSPQQITLTITNLNNVLVNEYTPVIQGVSASITRQIDLPKLNLFGDIIEPVSLDSPENNAQNISTDRLKLTWDTGISNFNTTSYNLEVARDLNFNDIIVSEFDLSNNEYIIDFLLDWGTTYYWRIRPKNLCGEGNYSTIQQFVTEKENYCPSTFLNVSESEYISNVTFNSINNDSGDDHTPEPDDGYQDFTSIATNLVKGETYPISITANPVGARDHGYVFIDWNNNSRFDVATERYDLNTFSGEESTNILDILVPNDAAIGRTRMRVIIEYFDDATEFGQEACDVDHNSEFGETEDYTIFIVENSLKLSNRNFKNFSLYPNPASNEFNIMFDLTDINDDINIELINFNGQLLKTYNFTSNFTVFKEKMDINDISPGVYFLRIYNSNDILTTKIIVK